MPSDSSVLAVPMPHKHNADRRHHIPKISFKVQNWPAYEAGLRRRGSLLLWIEDGVLEHWQTCGPDGQARYTDAAIQTSLMLRAAFKLPLRQTEGLLASVLTFYWLRVSLTPRIRARGAEMADFFGYRLNGPTDVLSQHRHGGL